MNRMNPRKEYDMTPGQLKQFAMREWKQVASAAEIEEYEWWNAWITAENKNLAKRDWRYRKHIDGWCDTTLAQRDGGEGERIDSRWLELLSCTPDFLEIICTWDPTDVHEAFNKCKLGGVVKKHATAQQKRAMHYYLPKGAKTADAALALGTSERNVNKLLATAKKKILREMGATK
jgi:hypothetical protein